MTDILRDASYRAKSTARLNVTTLPGLPKINIPDRGGIAPRQGFRQTWQKTYRVRLSGCAQTPAEVIAAWKANLGSFWPGGSRFHARLTGMEPGEAALIRLTVGGPMRLSTGAVLTHVDHESLTFMDSASDLFSTWITLSAYEEAGCPVTQVQAILRASDPLYGLGMRLGFVERKEDQFWTHTLKALAAHFGVHGLVQMETHLS